MASKQTISLAYWGLIFIPMLFVIPLLFSKIHNTNKILLVGKHLCL